MIIYGDPGSSNTRRVMTVLGHLRIAHDFRLLNIFERANRTASYLSINPNGAIPAMVDGEIALFEASAIMIYLSANYDSALLPGGTAYFETLKWMFWAAEHFRRGPADLIEERFIKRAHGQAEDAGLCARAEAAVHRCASVLDGHLRGRRFVVGDRPTLADIDLAAPFSHVRRTRAPLHRYRAVVSWHDRLLDEVPAWRDTADRLERRIAEIERLHLTPAAVGEDRPMSDPGRNGVLLAVLPSYVIVILDVSIVNVALQSISRSLGGSIDDLQWTVSSYAVIFGSLLLCGGYLGDRFGACLCYACGLTVFGVASLLCGLSPSVLALIAFRALQGLGAALLVPNSLALVALAFPRPEDRARAFGLWAGCGGIAMASGPLVGGALIEQLGWRSVFLVNLPIVLAGLALVRRARVPRTARSRASFDLPGQAIAVAAIGSSLALLIEAPSFGWASPRMLVLGTAGAALWALLIVVEARRRQPMLPPALFKRREFNCALYVTFVSALAFYGFFFVISLTLQRSMNYSPLQTGIALLPLTVAVGVGSFISSRVSAVVGQRNAVVLTLSMYGAGFLCEAISGLGGSAVDMALAFPLIGLAAGAITPATTVMLMRSAEAHQSGIAAGIQNTSRQIGAALGVAAFGIFLGRTSPSSPPLNSASWLAVALVGSALLSWMGAFPRDRRAVSAVAAATPQDVSPGRELRS